MLRKSRKLDHKNNSQGAVLRVGGANLSPLGLTLLLTKQALKGLTFSSGRLCWLARKAERRISDRQKVLSPQLALMYVAGGQSFTSPPALLASLTHLMPDSNCCHSWGKE